MTSFSKFVETLNVNILGGSTQTDFLISHHFTVLDSFFSDVHNILSDSSLSLVDKQSKLEALNHYSLLSVRDNLNSLPSAIFDKVSLLDSLCSSYVVSDYTSEMLYLRSNKKPNKRSRQFSAEKTVAYEKLLVLFRLYEYFDKSIGLSLIFHMVGLLKRDFLNKKLIDNTNFFSVVEDKKFVLDQSFFSHVPKSTMLGQLSKALLETLVYYCRALELDSDVKATSKKNKRDQLLVLIRSTFSESLTFSDLELGYVAELLGVFLDILDIYEEVLLSNNEISDASRKNTVYVLKDKFMVDLFTLYRPVPNLPMICEPLPWVFFKKKNTALPINSNINYCSGGFLVNKSRLMPGVVTKNSNSIACLTESELSNINYLQSIPFQIDSIYLDDLIRRFNSTFFRYIYDTSDLPERSIFNVSLSYLENVNIINFEEYLNSHSEYSLLKKEYDSINTTAVEQTILKKKNKLKYKLSTLINEIQQDYITQFFSFARYLFTLYYSCLFKNYNLYFVITLDYRGRLYYNSQPLCPQSGSLSLALLKLGIKKGREKNNSCYKLFVQSLKNTKKDFFLVDKLIYSKLSSDFIGLDATASGLQMMALIVGDLELLFLTNVFSLANKKVLRQDLYGNFLDKFKCYIFALDVDMLDQYKKRIADILNKTLNFYSVAAFTSCVYGFLDTSVKVENLTDLVSLCLNSILFLLRTFLLSVVDRAFIKDLVMCFVYSEGHYSRIKKIIALLSSNLKDLPYILFNKTKVILNNNSFIYLLADIFSHLFLDSFYKAFPLLRDLQNKITTLLCSSASLEKNRGINLGIYPKSMRCFYEENKCEVKTFDYINHKGQRRKFNLNLETDKIDLLSHKRSIMPNFIHHIDSRLLNYVVARCRVQNITLFVNHDCFYCSKNHAVKMKRFYYKGLLKILKADVLEYLFKLNKINKNDYISYVENIRKEREKIIGLIRNKTIIMSKNILN